MILIVLCLLIYVLLFVLQMRKQIQNKCGVVVTKVIEMFSIVILVIAICTTLNLVLGYIVSCVLLVTNYIVKTVISKKEKI